MVRPIAKRSPPRGPEDLRPISITCAPSKILESVALRQIAAYVSSRTLLYLLQSGFREGCSTHTALIKMMDDIRVAVDAGKITLLVIVDYSRAFDLVNVGFLADKLRAFDFSASVCE